ncbi:MAG: asparagine synthase (glutamine-hydrolyzing) [Deltaproteobacteria bacterium]|nr:asparagine synthase (glutamine-hydrolyzing) [Deltaproteobacteria bacterium]
MLMCGILAICNFNNEMVDDNLLIRMRDTMYHRGPDQAGVYVDGSVALAHRRLSIIDLSETGRQPMTNEDRTLFLVCNGEIYNYLELRDDLLKKGHRFYSNSDSEVIIHQYEEDGEECLLKFNGMFAFILWDISAQRIFGARDRLGIKPLYYHTDNKRLILASEIKAIIRDPSVPRIPDYEAISDYLFCGRALGDKTLFRNIREIEPGYMINVNKEDRHFRIRKYWDISYNYDYNRQEPQLIGELSFLLDDAVKIHCRSDASLGCHLSGGLDSSTVVALASKYRNPLKTFSIKFSDDAHIDETKYAKAVARHVGADYHERSPTAADLQTLLTSLMWYMDVPMVSIGGFAYYTVSRLAREYVKVSLTGHGGDELFAGYHAQFKASFKNAGMFHLHEDPDRIAKRSMVAKLLEKLVYQGPKGLYRSMIDRLNRKEDSFEDTWIQLHCSALPHADSSLHQSFVNKLQGYSPRDAYIAPLKIANTVQLLDRCLYHDLKVYLPSLLHMEDRSSMSLSIESRVPLLDYRIAEFLATVPPDKKVRGLQPKYLLRMISSCLLPEEIWKRKDKFPFPVPQRFWSSSELKNMTKKLLLSEESLGRGIFKPYMLKNACSNYIDPWLMINIELWFKLFIDQDPIWLSKIAL